MNYFEKYTSNSLAGSSNQSYFLTENESKIYKSRTFYKLFSDGEYFYSFLFSNTVDSTYSDGSFSKANREIAPWTLHAARVYITDGYDSKTVNNLTDPIALTFAASPGKQVLRGESFFSDEVLLRVKKDGFLCLELEFSGREIPCHPELIIPSFIMTEKAWIPSENLPVANMIGALRPVKKRIAFWGDSITQGIGTRENSYNHWCARLAEMLGDDYSYWNLGIGYGRAEDAATLGSWYGKVENADLIIMCFGVNDIMQGKSAEEIKSDLLKITEALRSHGKTVLLQSVPPFDYDEEKRRIWLDVNSYIKDELSKLCDAVFDNIPILGLSADMPHMAKYGGHPDEHGSLLWAEALLPTVKEILMR